MKLEKRWEKTRKVVSVPGCYSLFFNSMVVAICGWGIWCRSGLFGLLVAGQWQNCTPVHAIRPCRPCVRSRESVILAVKSVVMYNCGEGVRNPMGHGMNSKAGRILRGQSICMMNRMKVDAMETLPIDGDACPVRSVPKNVLRKQDIWPFTPFYAVGHPPERYRTMATRLDIDA